MDFIKNKLKDNDLEFIEDEMWYYVNSSKLYADQGWKIHLSTQLKNYRDMLDAILPFLISHQCSFKICKNIDLLKRISSPREISPTANKFITIYNNDDDTARKNILEIFTKVSHFKSPKILSDFQCGIHSPVHYRYGAFKKISKYDRENRKLIFLIKNKSGQLVEDKRTNYPITIDGIKPLFTANEHQTLFNYDKLQLVDKENQLIKYNLQKILKRSNRGNVYFAESKKTGDKVVVKQCRPFLYYDLEGSCSAADELHNEANMLTLLNDRYYTGQFIEDFYVLDDYFIVQKYIEGENLLEFFNKREVSSDVRINIINELVVILNDLHSHGYKIMDLSPSNFLYSEKSGLVLIDLESVVSIEDKTRNVKTKFFINPDKDLKENGIEQEYFALCMIGYFVFTGKVLPFLRGDLDNKLSTIDKVFNLFKLANREGKLNNRQLAWLEYLLSLSSQNDLVKIDDFYNFKKTTISPPELSLNYNFNSECYNMVIYLLSQAVNSKGRISKSTEFGEFVNPLSFQHGLSGLLIHLKQFSLCGFKGKIEELLYKTDEYSDQNSYYQSNSLLFGKSGYLWAILDLPTDLNKLHLADKISKKLMTDYIDLEDIDFALGKSGVLLALMKYQLVTGDYSVEKFIRNKITEIFDYFLKREADKKLIMDYSFAHGYCGIAFVLETYSILFEEPLFTEELSSFASEVKEILKKEILSSDNHSNLELSWCEGLSGLLLYLCLTTVEIDNKFIINVQEYIFKEHINMLTGYCHGIASLMQSLVYVNNKPLENKIKHLLIARSFRNEAGLLMFQGDDGEADLFDFGVGSLGVYWCLLGNRFPFELKKEDKK